MPKVASPKVQCKVDGCTNTFDPKPKGHRGRPFQKCATHRGASKSKAAKPKAKVPVKAANPNGALTSYSRGVLAEIQGRLREINEQQAKLEGERARLEGAVTALTS